LPLTSLSIFPWLIYSGNPNFFSVRATKDKAKINWGVVVVVYDLTACESATATAYFYFFMRGGFLGLGSGVNWISI